MGAIVTGHASPGHLGVIDNGCGCKFGGVVARVASIGRRDVRLGWSLQFAQHWSG